MDNKWGLRDFMGRDRRNIFLWHRSVRMIFSNVVRRCCSFRMLRPFLVSYFSGDDGAVDVDTRAVSACVGIEGA
jgi:hypothetical protein